MALPEENLCVNDRVSRLQHRTLNAPSRHGIHSRPPRAYPQTHRARLFPARAEIPRIRWTGVSTPKECDKRQILETSEDLSVESLLQIAVRNRRRNMESRNQEGVAEPHSFIRGAFTQARRRATTSRSPSDCPCRRGLRGARCHQLCATRMCRCYRVAGL